MKEMYVCDICKQQFDNAEECDAHEKRHSKIKALEKKNKPKFHIGDRLAKPNCKSIPAISGMRYDVDKGWLYDIGIDEYFHQIAVEESKANLIADNGRIRQMAVCFTRELRKFNKSLMAVYLKNDEDCFQFEVVHDDKLETTIKLVKKHLKDGAETTHAIYYPTSDNEIKLVEFVVDVPIVPKPTPIWYPPSRGIKSSVGLCLLNSKQYDEVIRKPIEIGQNWYAGTHCNTIDIIGLL